MTSDRQPRRMNDELGPNPFRIGGRRWVGVIERKRLEKEQLEKEQCEKPQPEREQLEKVQIRTKRPVKQRLGQERPNAELEKESLERAQPQEEQVNSQQLHKQLLEEDQSSLPPLVGPRTLSWPHPCAFGKQRYRRTNNSSVHTRARIQGRWTAYFSQPQPFPQSILGNLPGEIRNLIYDYVLIVPPSHVIARGGPKIKEEDSATSGGTLLATLDISERQKPSCTAMLQVCRQIRREANHIFYARNAFSFATARELRGFLVQIGPAGRQEIRFLHIDIVLSPVRIWTDDEIDKMCADGCLQESDRQSYASSTTNRLSSDAAEAARLLNDSKNLLKISFNLETEYDAMTHVRLLRDIAGCNISQVDFVNQSHWLVTYSENTDDWLDALILQRTEIGGWANLFGKGQHRVEVDFRMDPGHDTIRD